VVDVEEEEDKEKGRIRSLLEKSVEELELSVRSANCLRAADIKTIADLVQKPESAMLKYRNFGRKSLKEISDILTSMGLQFGMEVTQYVKPGRKVSDLEAPRRPVIDEDALLLDDDDDEEEVPESTTAKSTTEE
jgi:DNA-directed RNA polymerase subunit alpha